MQNALAPDESLVLLEALLVWVLNEATDPIRSSFLDERLKRAIDRAGDQTLKTYHSSGSFDAGLAAGKEAFHRDFAGAYVEADAPMTGSRSRVTPALWLETREPQVTP